MTNEEIMKALEEVHKMCDKRQGCEECPFDDPHNGRYITCCFGELPYEWPLDKIKMKKGEINDK